VIDIIIPNWNGRQLLETCLHSLSIQTCQKFSVIVVDNGSSDDSVEFIQCNYPDVSIISLTKNLGFSAAINAGIQAGEHSWVFLLNNDVEVHQDCIEHLIDICDKDTEYDIYALKMIDFKDRSVVDGAGDWVLRGGVGYRLGTMEKDCDRYCQRRDVFGACAGAALYRRSLFADIGYFDEDFFAYLEDVDFNMRAARNGSRCCFLPDAVVYHMGSASTGSKINPFTVKLSTRNNIFIIVKNYSPGLFFRFLPAILIYQLFWFLFVLKHRQISAYLSGLLDSVKYIKTMWRHNTSIRVAQKITDNDFRRKIIYSEKQVIESIMNRRRLIGKTNRLFELYLRLFCC